MSTSAQAPPHLEELLARYEAATHADRPDKARQLGLHEYDGLLPPLTSSGVADRLSFLESMLEELGPDPRGLDARLFAHALRSERWFVAVMRRQQSDPMYAGELMDPSVYVKRDYAPLAQRADALRAHLLAVPEFLESAREQLDRELSTPCLETAIDVFEGLDSFLHEDLPAEILDAGGVAMQDARQMALKAVREHRDELATDFLPKSRPEFAVGAAAYSEMLRDAEGIEIDPRRLLEAGERDQRRNHQALVEIADSISPGASPSEVVAAVAAEHPSAAGLLDATRDIVEELRAFLHQHPLVSQKGDDQLLVQPTPPFMRWAEAALDHPGVFEKDGLNYFYYMTAEDDAPRMEESLREFNHAALRVISVHEVFPGHFVHAQHARRAPSRATKLFAESYHFWEGWAHYAEEMFLEEGYAAGDPRVALMQRVAALHRNARLVCSVGMHTADMTLDEATEYFSAHAFVGKNLARKEAIRGTFDPQYMGYTLGKLLILRLREDVKAAEGADFDLRRFHDRFLSVGAPPIPLVREEVFGIMGGSLL